MLNVRPYTPALQKLAAKFDCGNSYLNQFLRSPDALDADITFSPSHGEDKCICLYLPLDY